MIFIKLIQVLKVPKYAKMGLIVSIIYVYLFLNKRYENMRKEGMIEHLNDRYFNRHMYYGISITDETVTFPLWNLSGQMVGYQQYRPDGSKKERRNPRKGRYYTWIRKEEKQSSLTAWGLDVLDPYKRVIYLLEGVFKACRFHNYGLNALATLSNDPKHLKTWINSLGYEIRPVCDGDNAGVKLAKYGSRSVILPDGVYVDEMNNTEFGLFISEFCS